MAAKGEVTMYVGEDITVPDTIRKRDGVTPQDISGWTITMVVHPKDGSAAVITKTVGAGIILTDPTHGLLTATILRADTLSLKPDEYVYYFLRTDAGNFAALSVGTFRLKPL